MKCENVKSEREFQLADEDGEVDRIERRRVDVDYHNGDFICIDVRSFKKGYLYDVYFCLLLGSPPCKVILSTATSATKMQTISTVVHLKYKELHVRRRISER